jgi:hypothetical protein
MKGRYENDYLAAHREKLVLQRDLEEIRSGKSMGDGLVVQISCFCFPTDRFAAPRQPLRFANG